MRVRSKCGDLADETQAILRTRVVDHSLLRRALAAAALKNGNTAELGSCLFIRTLALVLFQFLSRVELRAADHTFVYLVWAFYFTFHTVLLFRE